MTTSLKTERTTTGWDKYYRALDEELTAKAAADIIADDIRSNFRDSVTVEGAPLKPLRMSTIIRKTELDFPYPEKPLVASTQLAKATEAFEVTPERAEVKVQDGRFQTAQDQGPAVSNTQLLDKFQGQRPVWGLGSKGLKKLSEWVLNISKKINAGR